ncbi:MAG: aspartate 1-decarboxylase [Elusimicrobia bacterium]|nr:aspartate 1-decarboxylase [Elusimicrobiota bacterium]
MLKSKLHRARVTDAQLDYPGSIGIDSELLARADILAEEQVHVYNVTTGSRFVTYAIPEKRGSRRIVINGAAAHLAKKGDVVIVASYVQVADRQARGWKPQIVLLDSENRAHGKHPADPGGG